MIASEKDPSFFNHLTKLNINNAKICANIAIVLELVLLGRNIYYYGVTFHYYVQLYLSMLIASLLLILSLIWLERTIQNKDKLLIYTYRIMFCYYLFTLFWGVTVTLIDQQSYGQVTAFLVNLLIACTLFVCNIRTFFFLHIGPILVLVVGMYFINPELRYVSGHLINITVFYIFAILASRKLYNYIQKSYYQEKTLNKNNAELHELNMKLNKLANYDALTNLANRHHFQNYVQKTINQSQSVTIFLLDIDYFKLYNDYYGHQKGDDVLRQVASAIQFVSDQHQLFAVRHGGEEFLVIGYNLSETQMQQIANEINEAIQNLQLPHAKSETAPFVTASLGFAHAQQPTFDQLNQLIAKADEALYSAKKNGRNQNVKYTHSLLIPT